MHPRDLPPRLPQNRQKGWSGPISRVLSRASIYLGHWLPSASSGQPGTLRRRANAGPFRELAPYLALLRAGFGQPACLHTAGALLPHHFTLAHREVGGMFLCHFPSGRPAWVLPSALPCGARTFLTRQSLGDGGRGRSAHSVSIVAHSVTTRATSSCRHWRMPYQGQRHWGPDLALIC